jgi:site-specific DNA-methyltransferase (adenine-specific)
VTEPWQVIEGEALAALAGMPSGSCEALVTDPPYSSGGQFRGDRQGSVHAKYGVADLSTAGEQIHGFSGDNRDQRAYAYWSALWLSECLRIVRPGGAALVFTDWRQLPTTVDAFQAGGWVWRGIVPWLKTGTRPLLGGFTAACEYVVWGTAGAMDTGTEASTRGFIEAPSPRDREHPTQKPLEVMRHLMVLARPGGIVLDPFAGSGTTGVAALVEGRRFLGVEQHPEHAATARRRCAAAAAGWSDSQSKDTVGLW